MDYSIRKILKDIHAELLQKCPYLYTKVMVNGKPQKKPVNHYARLKQIVANGGNIVEVHEYANAVIKRYNEAVSKHTGKPIPGSIATKNNSLKIVN